jgi:hypothetical protein
MTMAMGKAESACEKVDVDAGSPATDSVPLSLTATMAANVPTAICAAEKRLWVKNSV